MIVVGTWTPLRHELYDGYQKYHSALPLSFGKLMLLKECSKAPQTMGFQATQALQAYISHG